MSEEYAAPSVEEYGSLEEVTESRAGSPPGFDKKQSGKKKSF